MQCIWNSASYLVGCEGTGIAAVVDPNRDVQKYLDAAAAHRTTITHISETHLHAHHVPGDTNLAARTNAEIYVHEAVQAEFPYQPLRDGDSITPGNVELRVHFPRSYAGEHRAG